MSPNTTTLLLVSLVVVALYYYYTTTTTPTETYPEPVRRPSNLHHVESIHQHPAAADSNTASFRNRSHVPAFGTLEPALPITSSSYGTNPELPAFMVRYISGTGAIEKHCLKRVMAESIPSENVLSGSLLGPTGVFSETCPAHESLEYKPWPF